MAKVYISGDPREFGSYVEALRERLRDHGHKVRTRDDVEEGKGTRLDRVDEAILKSDVVLCLMGERYGEAAGEEEQGLRGEERYSLTQWEFVLARKHGKEPLVYYADDEAPLDAPNTEVREVKSLQEAFLAEEVVGKGTVCQAFRDQADLVGRVLALESGWPQDKEMTLQNPYVGLRRFEERDRERFFGRERLVQEVLQRMERQSLTTLVGQSGAGKSSLVRAGVVPAWRKKHPEGKVIVFEPDRDPFASLAGAMAAAGFDEGRVRLAADPSESVFGDLRRGSPRATDPLGIRAKPAGEAWLVVVDQFEEIFTRPGQSLDDLECIRRFAASLVDAAQREGEGLRVVLALRDDFFAFVRNYPLLYPWVDGGLIRVASPDGKEFRAIMEGPARAHGVKLEDGLVPAMLADMEECKGGLPMLGYALARLWEAEAAGGMSGGMLQGETYRKTGGVSGALRERMALYLGGKKEEERRTVQTVMLALVSTQGFEGIVQPYSRPLPRSELLDRGGKGSQELLRELIGQEKVLWADEETNAFDPLIELAHEALIRGWDLMGRWVEGSREALQMRDRLGESARSWDRVRSEGKGKAREIRAELWRGGKLARALEFCRVENGARQSEFERIGGLGLLEQDFLKASEQASKRPARLVKRLAVGVAAVLVFAVGSWVSRERKAFVAGVEERKVELEAQLGEARREAALGWLARAERAEGTPEAGFYAARALGFEGLGRPLGGEWEEKYPRLLPADEWGAARAREAWRWMAQAPLPYVWSSGRGMSGEGEAPEGAGAAVAWSPDGKWWASGGPGMEILLWEVGTGELAGRWAGHSGAVTSLGWSPDGKRLVSGSADKTVRLWTVPGGEEFAVWSGHTGWVGAVAFHPDGEQVVSGGYDETVRIWDAKGGGEARRWEAGVGFVYAVAFGPDGTQLAVGGEEELVQVWDLESGEEARRFEGHGRSVNGLAFSPSGKWLASASSDETVRIWDVSTAREARVLAGHRGGVGAVAWCAGDEWLASGGTDRTIRVWRVESGKERCVLTGHGGEVTALAWDPGKSHLLSAGRAGEVKLWMAPRTAGAGTGGEDGGGEEGAGRELFRYMEGGAADFDEDSGKLVWSESSGGWPMQDGLIHEESWVGILRGAGEEEEKAWRLFLAALAAEDWPAAVLLSQQLTPGKIQESGEAGDRAAQILARAAREAGTRALTGLRVGQGRALVSWHEVWRELDAEPEGEMAELVAELVRPFEEAREVREAAVRAEREELLAVAERTSGEAEGENGESGVLRAEVIGDGEAEEAPGEPLVHVVAAGENPSSISKLYGVGMVELMEYNQIKDPRRLQIGAELKIPPGGRTQAVEEAPVPAPEPEPDDPNFRYHTVRAGENPGSIARRYRVLERDLMKLNAIEDPNRIQIGTRLKIPN